MKITKQFCYGDHTVTLETGRIARQANSVMVEMAGTVVMVNAVGIEKMSEQRDFFPLRVDYSERSYCVGKIPGGFFKREGRPTERETLVARLIDRPLRPLFPKGFHQEVQVVATVLSLNPECDPDVLAMIGASAAIAISGMPFKNPMAAARVGYVDGQYIMHPSQTQLAVSDLNLVVAGTKQSVLMVESEAKELSEAVMLGAVMFGHKHFQPAIEAITELAQAVGKPAWNWACPEKDTAFIEKVKQVCFQQLETAYQIQEKSARKAALEQIENQVLEACLPEDLDSNAKDMLTKELIHLIQTFGSQIVRGRILQGQPRIDGRDNKTVRRIEIETGILPRVHGSALFTRGETQSIATVTLGMSRDAKILDNVIGEEKESFMLHYNFPPYCVGEVGMVGSPKRREIGHGRLAKRAIQAVLPSEEKFPYVIRAVSEITESNGSSSQASVCGVSLALLDAGVPIKAPVAGIAMGLIKEGDQYAVLTDILGDEDHLGDMDFKVAGSEVGITALQMDIKIAGITQAIMSESLLQAKAARMHILGIMNQSLAVPKGLSEHAPKMLQLKIKPDQVREVIGKGGATIRQITEDSGATIELEDDGTVRISAVNQNAAEEAKMQIELLTAEVMSGQIYEGKVVRLADFGAFVNILPGKDGLVHVSEIAHYRVKNVSDELQEGQMVQVKVLEVDRQGRVRLSMKALLEMPESNPNPEQAES